MNLVYTDLPLNEVLAITPATSLLALDNISNNTNVAMVAYADGPILTADQIHTGWLVAAVAAVVIAIFILNKKTKK